jgi:hypothetical protein
MWSPQQEAALKAVDRWFYQESISPYLLMVSSKS